MVSLMKKDYDFILIDCPAGLERGLRNVLRAGKALRTLLIVTPDDLSIRDGERVIQLAEDWRLPGAST
jgi:septum site-determining protein MinD